MFACLLQTMCAIELSGLNVTADTYVRGGSTYRSQNFHGASMGWWDGPFDVPSAATSGVLLRFDLSSVSQEEFISASLTLRVTNDGSTASLRELLVPWAAATVTYASLPWDASSWRASEVAAVCDAGEDVCVSGWHSIDVTTSVRHFLQEPASNFGWVVLPTGGTNGGQIQLSRSTSPPVLRLEVLTSPGAPPMPPPPAPPAPPAMPPTRTLSLNDYTSNFTGGCQSTYIRQHKPYDNFGDAEGLWWDGNSKTGYRDAVLVQFSHLFGEGAHQIRRHDALFAATLRYADTLCPTLDARFHTYLQSTPSAGTTSTLPRPAAPPATTPAYMR